MTTTEALPYRDPSLAVADRVSDLLNRMTLAEKLAQLGSAWVFEVAGPDGFDRARAMPLLANGIGHITRASGASLFTAAEAATFANQLQAHLIEHTRLGIPAIVHEEICAGLMAREATVFPQALGVAATFRPELNRQLADAVRLQARALGAHQGLSPVLDICRDPRWGRLEETYGEDPVLVTDMGLAYVRGLQGDDLRTGVAATVKHFVGYGASEGGFNWAPVHLGERELRDVYLRPFEAAVRVGGLVSLMHAYHELDGVPCTGNRWLLTELLRDEWGFDGSVVSDYFAIRQLQSYHHVVATAPEAAALALTSGIDVELPGSDCYGDDLLRALDDGLIGVADIDVAVARVLDNKFRLGLFEQPFVDLDRVAVHTRTKEQLQLARQIAADSIVLLKNDGILPLSNPSSIAVIGPSADNARTMLGDYSFIAHVESLRDLMASGGNVFSIPVPETHSSGIVPDLDHVTTVLAGLTALLPNCEIRHAVGCGINDDDTSGFDDAVAAAAACDVAVLVMGDLSGLTAACTSGESRDVASLDLPGVQEQLVHAVVAAGTPVVLVLLSGRPNGSPSVHDAASAALMAWLPGEQGGDAIADVLCGVVSPGGKLPVTYPRSSGQIPVFYSHKVSGGRSHWKGSYVDLSNEPLYPFGFGLSYSSFEVTPSASAGGTVDVDDVVTVRAAVTNTGTVRSEEVVQLYSRDPIATLTRPVLELQAYLRVTVDPGASATVEFVLPVSELGYHGTDNRYVVEPGEIELLVGNSSQHLVSAGTITISGAAPIAIQRTFTAAAHQLG